jgi:hypothetical protein
VGERRPEHQEVFGFDLRTHEARVEIGKWCNLLRAPVALRARSLRLRLRNGCTSREIPFGCGQGRLSPRW